MPSRYEPCGLNQMYSLRYGTVPIVREVGGLADTVRDADRDRQRGNGFTFGPYHPRRCGRPSARVSAFADPERWRTIALRGMAEDFSWDRSAEAYQDLYRESLAEETGGAHGGASGGPRPGEGGGEGGSGPRSAHALPPPHGRFLLTEQADARSPWSSPTATAPSDPGAGALPSCTASPRRRPSGAAGPP